VPYLRPVRSEERTRRLLRLRVIVLALRLLLTAISVLRSCEEVTKRLGGITPPGSFGLSYGRLRWHGQNVQIHVIPHKSFTLWIRSRSVIRLRHYVVPRLRRPALRRRVRTPLIRRIPDRRDLMRRMPVLLKPRSEYTLFVAPRPLACLNALPRALPVRRRDIRGVRRR
jgi:hypothetical protein